MKRWYVPFLRLLAPVTAVAFALFVSGVVLKLSGSDPIEAFQLMWDFGTTEQSIASIVDRSVPLYLSGVAFAVAFKMGLFNIGVEGQYTVAVIFAAYVGANVTLTPVLHVALTLLVAMTVGMAWAAIAGVLKVARGVHEVISTIMLNAIGIALVGYLLANHFLDRSDETLNLQTEKIPASGQFPDLVDLGPNATINALRARRRGRRRHLLRADLADPVRLRPARQRAQPLGRPGQRRRLRRDDRQGHAAVRGGGRPRRACPPCSASRTTTGWTSPPAWASPASPSPCWAATTRSGSPSAPSCSPSSTAAAQILDLEGIAKEIVVIMEGVIVLSVVVAYELVQRFIESQERKLIGEETPSPPPTPAAEPVGAPA